MKRAAGQGCAIVLACIMVSACCTGSVRRQIENAHLHSGGAVKVFKFGYPVIGVGYNNVYVATSTFLWCGDDGRVEKAGLWTSDYFCMTQDEFSSLESRLAAIDIRARLARIAGFEAGMRGDHIEEGLVGEDFRIGLQAAGDVKGIGVIKITHH